MRRFHWCERLENRLLLTATPVTITGGDGGDQFYVRMLDSLTATIGVWFNSTSGQGLPSQSLPVATTASLSLTGTGADARLTVDLSGGAPVLSDIAWNSSGPLTIVSGSGANAITIRARQITYGSLPITFTSPETITLETATGTDTIAQTASAKSPTTLLTNSGTTSVSISAGAIAIGPQEPGTNLVALGTLSISGGATASILAPSIGAGPTIVDTASLSVASNSQLDLTNNDLVVQGGNLSSISALVSSGYDNGLWNGPGIVSSDAGGVRNLSAIAVVVNNDGSGHPLFGSGTTAGLFDGISPGFSDVLLKFTDCGDANLDGRVDGSDYSKIDNGYGNHLSGWANGDFNYDGKIDGSDYTLIDNAFNTQTLAGFAAGWSYHVPIQLTGTDNAAVNNATVQVQLTAPQFNFSMAKADGSDIRFVDSDGVTMLPFYRAAWNAASQSATFYVKVPYFPVNSTKTIYVLAGNPSAVDASSYANTMQSPTVDVGTLADWPLNDGTGNTAADTTGNYYPLTFPAGVTWGKGDGPGYEGTTAGFTGSYARINGVNQYAQAAGLLDTISSDLTIAGWVRFDNITGQRVFVWEKTESNSDFLSLQLLSNTLLVQDEYGYISSQTPVAADTWYYVASEFGEDGRSLFVDGQLVASNPSDRDTPHSGGAAPFTFGADTRSGTPSSFCPMSFSGWTVESTDETSAQIQAAFQGSSYLGTDERSKWVRSTPNPVITAVSSLGEQSVVQEPCPWYDPNDNLFKMIFTGGWGSSFLEFATSPDGVHWTQLGDAIGGNSAYSGSDAAHASVYVEGNTVYCYFCGQNDIWESISTDGGLSWNPAVDVISHSVFSWTASTQLANTDLIKRGPNDYVMFVEGNDSSAHWEIGAMTAPSPNGPFTPMQADPIASLALGPVFGGPDVHLINGVYHIWEHIVTGPGVLPSEIAELTSTDLLNWTPVTDDPVLGIEDPSFEFDQTADPALLSVNGITYMWYSGMNNSTQVGAIGLVTYQGNFAQLVTNGTVSVSVQ